MAEKGHLCLKGGLGVQRSDPLMILRILMEDCCLFEDLCLGGFLSEVESLTACSGWLRHDRLDA